MQVVLPQGVRPVSVHDRSVVAYYAVGVAAALHGTTGPGVTAAEPVWAVAHSFADCFGGLAWFCEPVSDRQAAFPHGV